MKEVCFLHIGRRLKEIRSLRGMTQTQASYDITSPSHYSNIENGRFEPSNGILELLAERFSVPTHYLVNKHIIDDEISELLKRYEELLNQELLSKSREFREKHKEKFNYIPSLTQELYFRLLRCLEFFKTNELKYFKKFYSEKIFPIVGKQFFHSLPFSIQEKVNYISGLYHYMNNNYEKSILFFEHVLKQSEDEALQAKLTFNIALANLYLHNPINVLTYAKKSKTLYLNLHNWKKTAECYNLIAIVYKNQNDFKASAEYINKGLQILNNKTEETYPMLLHTLALLYRNDGQYDKALNTINTCIALKEKFEHDDLFVSYRAKLNILLETHDEYSILKTIILARKSCQSKLQKVHLQVIEGKLFYLQKRYSDYEKSLQSCIDYYLKNQEWENLKKVSKDFSHYYAENRKYKKAYELSQLYLIANENI